MLAMVRCCFCGAGLRCVRMPVANVVLATHMGVEVLAAYQVVNSSWNFCVEHA